MKLLTPDDDKTHQKVAYDTSKKEEEVENGDKDKDQVVLHLLWSKDALKALENFCFAQSRKVCSIVAGRFWKIAIRSIRQ